MKEACFQSRNNPINSALQPMRPAIVPAQSGRSLKASPKVPWRNRPSPSYMQSMTTHQIDLFARPLLPGVASADAFITPEEETALIALIDGADLSPFRFQGWLGKRLTASHGWHYDFENGGLALAAPLPAPLLELRSRVAAFACIDAADFVQVLLTRYDPGAGIGWHRDRPLFEHVVGVSLGNAAVMRFRRRRDDGFDRATLPLQPRSIYRLSCEARWDWEHSIVPMAATRWSVTFRTLSERGYAEVARRQP
jgi:alkylated DNA repair protein (DNA oxidative demethylase)